MPACMEEMFSPTKMESRNSVKGLRSVLLFVTGPVLITMVMIIKVYIFQELADGTVYVVQILVPVPSS